MKKKITLLVIGIFVLGFFLGYLKVKPQALEQIFGKETLRQSLQRQLTDLKKY